MNFIAPLIAIIREAFSYWRETKKEEHNTRIAAMQKRQQLLQEAQFHNHEWEIKSLENTGKFLKWFSFFIFSAPIFITVLSPEHGGRIWKNLELVPTDFMHIYFGITGAIWGIAHLKDAGLTLGAVIGAFKKGKK